MRRSIIIVLILAAFSGFAQKKSKISAKDLKEYVSFLASDSLKGRKPGTKEADVAAKYILQHFTAAGLKPLGDGGLQYIEVVTDVTLGASNALAFEGFEGTMKKNFIPLSFSSPGTVQAQVAFAGYGFNIDTDSLKWNDYKELDAKGKWVMVFRADPELDNTESKFIPFSDIRSKVLTAKDNGAAGILLVSPSGLDKEDKLMPLVVENNEVTAGLPVIHIKREVADAILRMTGFTADSLEALIARNKAPKSFGVPMTVKGVVDITQVKENTANVIGLLEGSDPVLKNEYLVIGAHYDHLGFGGPNSGSRMPDTVAVHNGADDNASGTAMVMDLAKKLASGKARLKRSIIFVAFSAEEMGLLGSKYFINHCPVDVKSIKAMFNFDMVGRFDKEKNSISVSGTGTSVEADSILKIYEKDLTFSVVHAPDGYGPSDHAAFYSSGIPVFYFNTGVHTDYHTPFDDTDKLDFGNEKSVGIFAENVIRDVDNLPKALTFKESGNRDQAGRGGRRLKVTLGILPDFAGTEKRGLRIDGVTKGGPADRGGMKKGDIITSLNGMSVGNIYEYMSRLSKLKHGMTVSVEVIRNEKTEILLIQL
jgi:aminopeptidase YwaD